MSLKLKRDCVFCFFVTLQVHVTFEEILKNNVVIIPLFSYRHVRQLTENCTRSVQRCRALLEADAARLWLWLCHSQCQWLGQRQQHKHMEALFT